MRTHDADFSGESAQRHQFRMSITKASLPIGARRRDDHGLRNIKDENLCKAAPHSLPSKRTLETKSVHLSSPPCVPCGYSAYESFRSFIRQISEKRQIYQNVRFESSALKVSLRIDQAYLKPPLPQGAAAPMGTVDVLDIAPPYILHGARYCARAVGSDKQVTYLSSIRRRRSSTHACAQLAPGIPDTRAVIFAREEYRLAVGIGYLVVGR